MGEHALRCQSCLGKFGPPVPSSVCELCWLQTRVREHLLSPRFPSHLGVLGVTVVKEAYYKLLDISETHWQAFSAEGSSEGSRFGGKGGEKGQPSEKEFKPEDKAQDLHPAPVVSKKEEKSSSSPTPRKPSPPLNLSAKVAAKPPASSKSEDREVPVESPPEGVPVPSGSRDAREHHRHRKKRHKSSRKDRSEPGGDRSPSRQRRRRQSGETHSSPRDSKRKVKESSPLREAVRRPARPSQRPSEPRRTPRSPSRPPPERGEWFGPIPAGHRRGELCRDRSRSPKYTNKGAKKRYQQARLKGKGKSKGDWFRR